MFDLPKLVEFLSFIAGPAGTLAVFVFVSDLIRNVMEDGGLANWLAWHVQLLVLGLSLVIPVAALLIITFVPATVLASAEPFWAVIGTLSVAYLVQLGYFKLSKVADRLAAGSYVNPKG